MLGSEEHPRGYALADAAAQDAGAPCRLLCKSLCDPFVRVAMDGRILECNALYCQLLGYSAQELRTLTYQDLTPARWHGLEDAIVAEQILPRGHSQVYEKEYRRKDGAVVPVELRTVLERDGAGRPLAMWAIVRDIGERKRAEAALRENEARLRRVVQAVGIGFFEWSPATDTAYWSPEHYALVGVEPDSPISWERWFAGVHPDDRERVAQNAAGLLERARAQGEVQGHKDEYRYIRPDASVIWLEADVSVETVDGEPIVRGAVREITERKLAEDALARARQLAERRAAELEAVLHAVPAAVWLAQDPECRHISGNRTANAWLGLPEGAVASPGAPDGEGAPRFRIRHDGRELDPTELPVQRAAAGVEVRDFEEEIVLDDGRVRHVLGNAIPLWDERGKPRGSVAAFVDITQRKQAEDALRENEERLRLALEAGGMATWDWCIESGEVVWNDEHYRMLGYAPGSVRPSYEAWANRIHPEDRAATEERFRRSMEEGGDYTAAFRAVWPDETIRWVEARGRFDRDTKGRVLRNYGVMIDITPSKHTEEMLRQSEARLQAVLDGSPDPIFLKDRESRLLLANPATFAVIGRPPEDCIGKTDEQLYANPADGRTIMANDRRIMAMGHSEAVEETVDTRSGLRHFVSHKAPFRNAAGSIVGLVGVARDITERKAAEAALRESEHRFRQVAESLPQLIWTCAADGPCDYLSPQWVRYTGKSEAEQLGYGWLDQVHPEDRQRVIDRWQATAARGGYFEIEFRIRRHDGAYRWFRTLAVPLHNGAGEVVKWFGGNTDIEDIKQGELALRESRQQLALALDAGHLGFWDWDLPSGRVQYGGRWATMLGYDPSEIEPHVRAWERLIHPDDRTSVMAALSGHLEGRAAFYECEHRMRHKDGSWRWILDRGQVMERDADGRPLRAIGTHTDVTARREAENALLEADRRKDELLATLAHELRNPLAPIRNALEIFRRTVAGDAMADRLLDMMDRQTTHLVRLVDDLLEVSRITRGMIELRKERVDLATVVGHAVETCRPLVDARQHELEVSLPPEPLPIEADPVRLTQVLANLLNNAAKFTEPGGTIRIAAERHGSEAVASVRDSGVGIPAELLPRVFELFTQADRGVARAQGGLGIGLALVQRLVEMHGGRVEARSAGPGKGSELFVYLPLAPEAAVVTAVPESAEPAAPSQLPQRLLVVDDNRDAADSLAVLLQALGTEVRVVYDGPAALTALADFAPAVVLLDLGMPGMDGYETARRIRERPEGQKVVLIALTGWGQDEDRRRTGEAGFDRHLVKPVDFDLLRKLLVLLGRADMTP